MATNLLPHRQTHDPTFPLLHVIWQLALWIRTTSETRQLMQLWPQNETGRQMWNLRKTTSVETGTFHKTLLAAHDGTFWQPKTDPPQWTRDTGTLVEPWWNLGGTFRETFWQPKTDPPRWTRESPKAIAVGENWRVSVPRIFFISTEVYQIIEYLFIPKFFQFNTSSQALLQVTMPKLLLNSLSTCWLVLRAGRDKLLSVHKSLAGASLAKATWGPLKVPNGNDTLALAQTLLIGSSGYDGWSMLECCSQIFGSSGTNAAIAIFCGSILNMLTWKRTAGTKSPEPTTRWCQNIFPPSNNKLLHTGQSATQQRDTRQGFWRLRHSSHIQGLRFLTMESQDNFFGGLVSICSCIYLQSPGVHPVLECCKQRRKWIRCNFHIPNLMMLYRSSEQKNGLSTEGCNMMQQCPSYVWCLPGSE